MMILLSAVPALNNGLARTPARGWNAWNSIRCEGLNENLIREVADAMVSSGLRDAGYTYVNIDDCKSDRVSRRLLRRLIQPTLTLSSHAPAVRRLDGAPAQRGRPPEATPGALPEWDEGTRRLHSLEGAQVWHLLVRRAHHV